MWRHDRRMPLRRAESLIRIDARQNLPLPPQDFGHGFFKRLDGVRRSNYRSLKLITLLAQKGIVNYSAKLYVKTVTKLGVGGVDGVDATPHNRCTFEI